MLRCRKGAALTSVRKTSWWSPLLGVKHGICSRKVIPRQRTGSSCTTPHSRRTALISFFVKSLYRYEIFSSVLFKRDFRAVPQEHLHACIFLVVVSVWTDLCPWLPLQDFDHRQRIQNEKSVPNTKKNIGNQQAVSHQDVMAQTHFSWILLSQGWKQRLWARWRSKLCTCTILQQDGFAKIWVHLKLNYRKWVLLWWEQQNDDVSLTVPAFGCGRVSDIETHHKSPAAFMGSLIFWNGKALHGELNLSIYLWALYKLIRDDFTQVPQQVCGIGPQHHLCDAIHAVWWLETCHGWRHSRHGVSRCKWFRMLQEKD